MEMEVLAHDVVEQILERLPSKSLMRFKSVSKQWKSTIESPLFQHKHLNRYRQIWKTPHLLMMNTGYKDDFKRFESIMTLELESSISRNIPIPWENDLHEFCENSIDGLICLYNNCDSVVIFNPTTRWYRTLHPSTYQQKNDQTTCVYNSLGFGKDQINGLYKLVWLYNSALKNTTTCEVFDFKINAWRFVEPSSPRKVDYWLGPVYLTGLLYWLTVKGEEEECTSVLSFDLHTETFEVVCEGLDLYSYSDILMIFNLDDNLCASSRFDGGHEIWSLNLEEKTWKKIYFIDLAWICPPIEGYERCNCDVRPLMTVLEKKKKLMLCDYKGSCETRDKLVIYESQTTSYCRVVSKRQGTLSLCYFQSLISIV